MRAVARSRSTGSVARVVAAVVVLALVPACGGPRDGTSPPTAASVRPTATTGPGQSAPTGVPTGSSGAASTPTSLGPTPTARPTATTAEVPAWLAGRDVRLLPTDRNRVVLTFDGGGNADGLAKILAVLDAEHVRGSFFLTGRWVQAYAAQARAVVAAGHVIGNHTMTHPHVTAISDPALTAQVLDAARVIGSTTGANPKPWFRFPYGERTSADIRLLNSLGYVCVSWSVDTLGWLGTSRGTVADVRRRVLDALEPGLVVLMHVGSNPDDGTTYDADALTSVIDAVRAAGYTFGTVAELITEAP